MAITYVSFKSPISIGGQYGTITDFSLEKHGKEVSVKWSNPFIVLTLASGSTREIHITNVGYIAKMPDEVAK